jgi:hypothetical protein
MDETDLDSFDSYNQRSRGIAVIIVFVLLIIICMFVSYTFFSYRDHSIQDVALWCSKNCNETISPTGENCSLVMTISSYKCPTNYSDINGLNG